MGIVSLAGFFGCVPIMSTKEDDLYMALIAAVEAGADYKEHVREDGSSSQIRSAQPMRTDHASDVADLFLAKHPETTADSVFTFIKSADSLRGQYGIPNDTICLSVHILNSLCKEDEALFMALFQEDAVPWSAHCEALYCLGRRANIDNWFVFEDIITREHFDSRIKGDAIELIVSHRRAEFLPVLQQQLRDAKPHEWDDRQINHLIFGCAAFGDVGVAPKLLALAESPWSHRWMPAQEALEKLLKTYPSRESFGRAILAAPALLDDEVWRDLKQHADGSIMRWGLENAPVSEEQVLDCVGALAFDEWKTCKVASDWLIAQSSGTSMLTDVLRSEAYDARHRSWAAYTSFKSGALLPEDKKLITEDPATFRFDWGFETPEHVRDSVIQEYVEYSEPGTDVRYYLERLLHERVIYNTDEVDRDQLVSALKADGLTIKQCVPAGTIEQQGGGTYWTIIFDDSDNICGLDVSTLGKFVSFYSHNEEDGAPSSSLHRRCRNIAEAQGFFWLDPKFGDQIVPGLNVYFFGSREPLSVRNLLFYWQD